MRQEQSENLLMRELVEENQKVIDLCGLYLKSLKSLVDEALEVFT